jgi:phosphate starvation-inducible PhoH-like protein
VVDGDVEQTDLPAGKKSGLVDALARFRGKSSFGVVEFTEDDIQRDPLVREIVKGYRKAA